MCYLFQERITKSNSYQVQNLSIEPTPCYMYVPVHVPRQGAHEEYKDLGGARKGLIVRARSVHQSNEA